MKCPHCGKEVKDFGVMEVTKVDRETKTVTFSSIKPWFVEHLPQVTQRTIVELYPDKEFLKREFLKMGAWLSVNSHKSPKSARGWARFSMGWLERGWDRYRVTLQSNPTNQVKWDEVFV